MVGDSVRMSARRVHTPGSSTQGNSSEVTIPVTSSSDQSSTVESFSIPSEGESTDMVPTPGTSDPNKSNRPKFYKTKYRKSVEKKNKRQRRTNTFVKAKTDLEAGKFKSVRQCAAFHKLPVSTLHRLFTDADEFQGSGRNTVSL